MKKNKVILIALSLILTLSIAVPAFAFGSSTTRIAPFHVNGWNYRGSVTVATYDATFIEARTWIYTECGRTLSSGILGAAARLYDTRGFLVDSTGMTSNDRVTSGIGVGVLHRSPRTQNDSRRFYAVGTVRVRNVSTGVYTYRSNVRSGNVPRDINALPMEERLYIEFNTALETNGMIPAVSINGIDGWVYANDLQQSQNNGFVNGEPHQFINVFDADGVTVICSFKIQAADIIHKP